MALYLIVMLLPFESSTVSSSSSSRGTRKARVGSFSVNSLFSSCHALQHGVSNLAMPVTTESYSGCETYVSTACPICNHACHSSYSRMAACWLLNLQNEIIVILSHFKGRMECTSS